MNHLLKKLLIPALALMPLSGAAIATEFERGDHYAKTAEKLATSSEDGKVEVIELFSYSCPHCFRLESQISQWKADLPDYVEFKQVPAIFRDSWLQLARVFYAAEERGELEQLHQKLFSAIHVDKKRLDTEDRLLDFVEEQGIDRDAFEKTMNSFTVKTRVKKALVMSQTSGITGVPAMIVNGEFRTDAAQAGSLGTMIEVVDYLIEREKVQ